MVRDELDQKSRYLRERTRAELSALRGPHAAWGYRGEQTPSVEPTALACLGRLASSDSLSIVAERGNCCEAASWMVSIVREDGSVPPSVELMTPGWATPYAILLWKGLDGYALARRRATVWLLRHQGRTHPRSTNKNPVIGHDSTLIGWPWVDGTHSWLEPTALAILALCREGLGDHPRVSAGIALILDRALDHGGWNYGGKAVFGRPLRAWPAPTGLALLALAARRVEDRAISTAVAYLRGTLPGLRSAVSLSWGVLGLRAHDACPRDATEWLAASHERCAGRPDAALGLALLLLASSASALEWLGAHSAGTAGGEGAPRAVSPGQAASHRTDRLTARRLA
jgi:hypothetical protein